MMNTLNKQHRLNAGPYADGVLHILNAASADDAPEVPASCFVCTLLFVLFGSIGGTPLGLMLGMRGK